MTKLRDDGYLETDDPVVAACFLGKRSRFIYRDTGEISDGLYTINAITESGWDNHVYPILIPAKTVAEVCGVEHIPGDDRWRKAIAIHVQIPECWPVVFYDWLRTHTKETT